MGHRLPAALRRGAVGPGETAFVGHAALLDEFRAMLLRTEGVIGRPLLVLADKGSGKSRLLNELALLFPASGSVMTLRCEPPALFGRALLGNQLNLALDAAAPRHSARATTDTFETRLRALADRRPLLCVIDDLHNASASELELFDALANICKYAQLTLIGAFSTEPRSGSAEAAVAASRWEQSGALSMRLPPLDRGAAELLLRNLLASRRRLADTKTKEAILDVASGNPRYMAEMVEALSEGEPVGTAPIPLSARTKVLELRQVLSKDAFEVLRSASVFGHSFSDEWLMRLCEQQGPRQVAQSLQECVDAGAMDERSDESAMFAFREPAVRFAFYDALITPQRRQTHARIAEVLTSLRTEPGNDALIARHWIDAGRQDVAIDWLGRAARFEASRSRYREAIELDRCAESLIESGSPAWCEVQSRLSESLAAVGDFKEAALVRRGLALQLLAAGKRVEGYQQLFNLMHDYYYDGRPQFARPIYRKLRHLPANDLFRVHVELGWSDLCAVGGYRDEAAEVVASLRIADDAPPELRVMYLKQSALLGAGDRPIERTMLLFERAAATAHDAGLYRDEIYVGISAANTAGELGDIESAIRWIDRVDAALAARPNLATGTTALAAVLRCELMLLRGRIGSARDALTTVRFAERLGSYWESCISGFAVFIGQRLGDASWVHAYFRPALLERVLRSRQIEGIAIVLRGFSETLLERGMHDTLRAALHTCIASDIVDPYFWIQLYCARYGSDDDLPAARQQIAAKIGALHDTVARGALALFDAFSARRTNSARQARKAALRAAEIYHGLGWRWVEALALETAGERAQASRLYAACGAIRDVEVAGSTRKARRAAFGSTLTPREEQIAELVRQGLTNREIAQRLRRSERTITHHVEAIFSKQGIRARWQLLEPAASDPAR